MPNTSRPRNRARTLLLAASVILLVACGAGSSAADLPAVVERDSAGVRVVENPAARNAALPRWEVGARPSLTIGSVDGEGPTSLHRVTGAARLDDGRIAIANSSSGEVRFFGAAGEPLSSVGRLGGGPGEFGAISALYRIAGDTLLAFDPRGLRLTVISPAAEVVRTFQIRGDGGAMLTAAAARDGALVASRAGVFGAGEPTAGFARHAADLHLADATGTLHGVVGSFPGPETLTRLGEGTISVLMPPFARRSYYGMQGDAIVVAAQEGEEYHVYDRAGALLRIVRTGAVPVPYTPAHGAAQFDRTTSTMPPEIARDVRAGLETLPTPETLPPHGPLVIDRDDNLWLSDYPDPGTLAADWTVFDLAGHALARVTLPDGFRVFDIGSDYVLGVQLDELDVEHVWVLELRRGNDAR